MRRLSEDQLKAIHAKAAGRSRLGSYMKRHPGVAMTAKRAAIVGAGLGGLVLASVVSGKLARRELSLYRNLRTSSRVLARGGVHGIPKGGLRALRQALNHDLDASLGRVVGHQRRQVGLARAGLIGALPAGGWASYPAVEDREDWREMRAGLGLPRVQVVRRRQRRRA